MASLDRPARIPPRSLGRFVEGEDENTIKWAQSIQPMPSPHTPLAWCIPNHALWLDTSANFARLAYSTMDAVAESANAEQTTFMDVATSAIQRAVGILGYPIAAAAEAPNFLYAAEEAVKVN